MNYKNWEICQRIEQELKKKGSSVYALIDGFEVLFFKPRKSRMTKQIIVAQIVDGKIVGPPLGSCFANKFYRAIEFSSAQVNIWRTASGLRRNLMEKANSITQVKFDIIKEA